VVELWGNIPVCLGVIRVRLGRLHSLSGVRVPLRDIEYRLFLHCDWLCANEIQNDVERTIRLRAPLAGRRRSRGGPKHRPSRFTHNGTYIQYSVLRAGGMQHRKTGGEQGRRAA
jgi:hypothetical protein